MTNEVTIGACRLIKGDCRDVLPTLGTVDCILTDPPYGTEATHAGHLSKITLQNGKAAGQPLRFEGISNSDMLALAHQWCGIASRWVVFTCEWKYMLALSEADLLVRFGIWRKPDGAPQFTGDRPGTGWEAVAICHRGGKKYWNGGGAHAFWTVPKHGVTGHPTEKPESLLKAWTRDFSDAGDLILDPFMGSGTTGVACVKLSRRFIGIEREQKYFDIARRRIEAAYAQPDLFVEQPKPTPPVQLMLLEPT